MPCEVPLEPRLPRPRHGDPARPRRRDYVCHLPAADRAAHGRAGAGKATLLRQDRVLGQDAAAAGAEGQGVSILRQFLDEFRQLPPERRAAWVRQFNELKPQLAAAAALKRNPDLALAGFASAEEFETWWNGIVQGHPNQRFSAVAKTAIMERITVGNFQRHEFESGYRRLMAARGHEWQKESGRYCPTLHSILVDGMWRLAEAPKREAAAAAFACQACGDTGVVLPASGGTWTQLLAQGIPCDCGGGMGREEVERQIAEARTEVEKGRAA